MRALLLMLGLALLAGHAQACSCTPMNAEASKKAASVVFKGTVESVSKTRRGTVATIRVESVVKGKIRSKTVKMRSNNSKSACGMEFKQGESMNFAGTYSEGRMRGNSCGQQGLNPPPENAPPATPE